jgi:hypothetical protein
MTRPSSFEEFWPDYLRAHGDERTRAMHIAGTAAGIGCAALAVATRKPKWALAALVSAYGAAWLSHATFERNVPATFSHPLWSLRGDLRMFRLALSGKLDREVARHVSRQAAADGTAQSVHAAAVAAGRTASS